MGSWPGRSWKSHGAHSAALPSFDFTFSAGFMPAGHDLGVVNVTSVQQALDALVSRSDYQAALHVAEGRGPHLDNGLPRM